MYIRRVTIENVKSFRGTYAFDLKPGVNFFVGDNNGGKSTILEAILFMFEGPSKTRWTPEEFYCTSADGPTSVEIEIAGDFDAYLQQDKFSSMRKFVFEDQGEKILRLKRSSEERTVVQGKTERNLSVKTACFWNPESKQFENPTGIDAKVKALFDFEAVWADTHPRDHIDFANNKTLGRLLDASFARFVKTDLWKNLSEAHKRAFESDGEDSFLAETDRLANDLKRLVDEQYGEASYRFNFGLPDASIFMKQGSLQVNDGAGETPIEGKGTGMQRAVALGLIQLYARSSALEGDENKAPLILMLDEPETWLHPTAQLRLGEAINEIGKREQVFIVTHSPYLIRKFDPAAHLLTILNGKGEGRKIVPSVALGLLNMGEPTWGEINYRAFGLYSNEFHNELYGYIQRHLEQQENPPGRVGEKAIDRFFVDRGIPQDKEWIYSPSNRCEDRTLPTYVRNSIHHPENNNNRRVTESELRESTELLVRIAEDLNR